MLDLNNPTLYINRELSQIAFNQRVLEECQNWAHPLLERLKFLAIFSSNMDEFFMVRVSGLKQQLLSRVTTGLRADKMTPREQLSAIYRTVTVLLDEAMVCWREILHPQLINAGIHLLNYDQLTPHQKEKLRDYFEREIFPVLIPLAFDPSRPFPHISNLSLNLAAMLKDPDLDEPHFARVKVPDILPRLIPLIALDPQETPLPHVQKFVWIEQVIAANLDRLFPGMEVLTCYPFRITRNNDMEIQEAEADDLLLTIEDNLRQRHFGFVVRLEIEDKMPDDIREILITNLEVESTDIYLVQGPLGLTNLSEICRLDRPELKDTPFQPSIPYGLRGEEDIFRILRRQDVLLHHPYDSFGPVVNFIHKATEDPDVLAIKQTLYRVGPNSPIVQALIDARENGKQVAALVELKARFDEESNIEWARKLENAGVHVVYGLIGLKTHCKICLVVRRERDGIRRYVHLSTGNYNAGTARQYTDLAIMSSDEEFGADASELFNFLTGYSKQKQYRQFWVAPVNLRENILCLIAEETRQGVGGYILMKMNSLVDATMIQALYRASQAGVKVDLIVRGICCLRPGLPGISENIRVISIVGRFLEHARAYYFHNLGNPHLYVGSADLMPRNLDRRVEVLFPIRDPRIRQEIVENILKVQLQDTSQARCLGADGTYVPAFSNLPPDSLLFNSQNHLLGKPNIAALP